MQGEEQRKLLRKRSIKARLCVLLAYIRPQSRLHKKTYLTQGCERFRQLLRRERARYVPQWRAKSRSAVPTTSTTVTG